MKIYCEHGALSKSLRDLQDLGTVDLVQFPYDPDSQSRHLTTPEIPSAAQWQDLNLPWNKVTGMWRDFSGSEQFPEIMAIIGPQNRRTRCTWIRRLRTAAQPLSPATQIFCRRRNG